MGLMDKVKAQAAELVDMAQAGIIGGQAKVSELQARRRADALLRDLGASVYAEHQGGRRSADRARLLRDLDRHAAEHGPIGASTTADSPSAWSTATDPGSSGSGEPDPAPGTADGGT